MWGVSCAFFLKVKTGTERASTIVLRAQAELWAQKRELLLRDQSMPLGIFILEAIYMGVVTIDNIKRVQEVGTPDIYIDIATDCEFKRDL